MTQATPKEIPNSLNLLPISVLLICLDQLSKLMATFLMDYATAVPIMPGFNLFLLHNKGVAFSFLADAGGWQRYLFIFLSSVISIVLLIWMKRTLLTKILLSTALILIFSGAIGNLIDRVISGYVVDFIDVYWQEHHWPVFNFSDIYISTGVAIIIIENIWEFKKSSKRNTLNTPTQNTNHKSKKNDSA